MDRDDLTIEPRPGQWTFTDAEDDQALGVERLVDQRVVVEVDDVVVVEVAVEPPGASVVEAAVGAGVVVEVHGAVQIGITVEGELDQGVGGRDGSAIEQSAGSAV